MHCRKSYTWLVDIATYMHVSFEAYIGIVTWEQSKLFWHVECLHEQLSVTTVGSSGMHSSLCLVTQILQKKKTTLKNYIRNKNNTLNDFRSYRMFWNRIYFKLQILKLLVWKIVWIFASSDLLMKYTVVIYLHCNLDGIICNVLVGDIFYFYNLQMQYDFNSKVAPGVTFTTKYN